MKTQKEKNNLYYKIIDYSRKIRTKNDQIKRLKIKITESIELINKYSSEVIEYEKIIKQSKEELKK
jgi:hypothetical protein